MHSQRCWCFLGLLDATFLDEQTVQIQFEPDFLQLISICTLFTSGPWPNITGERMVLEITGSILLSTTVSKQLIYGLVLKACKMYYRIICVTRARIFIQIEIGHQIRVRVLGEVQPRVLEYRNGEAATQGYEGRAGAEYRGGR